MPDLGGLYKGYWSASPSRHYIHGDRAFGPRRSTVEGLCRLQNKCRRIWTLGIKLGIGTQWASEPCFTTIEREQEVHLLRSTTATILSGLRKATVSISLSVVFSWMRFDPGDTNLDRWASA